MFCSGPQGTAPAEQKHGCVAVRVHFALNHRRVCVMHAVQAVLHPTCSWLMPLMVPGRRIMKMPQAAAA